jgi:hypothetical protein
MTMSASMITPQLLNALLSPDASIRSQAETVFQSLTVVDRVQGLLTQLCAGDGTEDARLSLLTAVLLRRNVIKFGPNHVSLLQELVHPLLQALSSASSSCCTQVGHCLAEVCASLSLIGVDNFSNDNSNNNNSPVNQVLPIILSAIQGNLQQGDVSSLKLLTALADRLFSKFAVPPLFRNSPSRRCLPLHHQRHHHHHNKLLWKPGLKSFSMPPLRLRLPTSPCSALHLLPWTNWWWTPLWRRPSWDLACSPFSYGFLLALLQTIILITITTPRKHPCNTCRMLP